MLQQWAQAQSGPVRQDVAEQLSLWLSTVDAVKLSRALHALESVAHQAVVPAGADSAVNVHALQASLDAVRAELTDAVTVKPAAPKPARGRADHTPVEGLDPEAEADFALHAARYLSVQKQMDTRLAALRVQLRQSLAAGPPALRQLAALDAVMEQMLGAHEQRLWASLPSHLERRMVQLRTAYQQRLEAAGHEDEASRWRLPGGWLWSFENDQRALLLAELQVRLQPLSGLVEAVAQSRIPTHANKFTREQLAGMIE